MRIWIYFLALAGTLILNACQNSQQQAAQQQAWDNMMVIHDEVMPRMSEINAIGKAIQAAQADTTLGPEWSAAAEKALDDLAAADNAMWDWMDGIAENSLPQLRKRMKHEDIMRFLEAQTAEVAKVKEMMLGSIANGQALLKKLPAPAAHSTHSK